MDWGHGIRDKILIVVNMQIDVGFTLFVKIEESVAVNLLIGEANGTFK